MRFDSVLFSLIFLINTMDIVDPNTGYTTAESEALKKEKAAARKAAKKSRKHH
eukprot:gene11169-16722_t